MIPALVLAAGASQRMGRPKALLKTASGELFIHRLIATLREGGVDDVVVVVAEPHAVQVRAAIETMRVPPRIVENPAPSRGQLSSILVGLDLVDRPGVTGVMVAPVDHALIEPETVRLLLEAHRTAQPAPAVVRPAFAERHGHPVIFDRSLFGALRHASPEPEGARAVVRAQARDGVDVLVDDPGAFDDIDTPVDYERLTGRSCSDI